MHFFRRSTQNKKPALSDYYESFDRVCQLVDETKNAIADNRWVKDVPRIIQFLEWNKYSVRIVACLKSAVYNRRIYDAVDSRDVKSEMAKLLSRMDLEEEKSLLRRRNIRQFTLAGVAAASVITSMWLLPINKYSETPSDVLTEGVNLILPSGKIIVVDDVANHTNIVDEKETVISKTDNSIVVEKKTEEKNYILPTNYHTLNVPRGYQHDIVLEDGTHVWLNSGSTLKFPSIFATDERKVFLEGEGYFEVTYDSLRTFVVQTNEQTLTVLGTKFNIYAYSDEPIIYAALLSGSIRVSSGVNEVTLMPNQCSELARGSGYFEIKTIDVSAITAWRNGMFVFDNNTLEQVLMKISRSYNVEITFDRIKARALVFSGNLPKYDSIGEMLENIAIAGQVKFEESDGRFIMTI